MNEVVIVSAVRTAGGRIGGSLKDVQPEDLAKVVIEAAIERAGVEPEAVDEVIIGQTKQSADAANLARVAALRAGLPVEVPAYTVMRQCGSGLQAVNNAAQAIMCGQADIVVAGGTESMSNAPYYLRGARFGYGAGNAVLVDSNTESQPRSQPFEVYGNLTMGLTAENVAAKYGITREEQDRFALASQEKALAAIAAGRFADEIVPVEMPQKKGAAVVFATDEHPRRTSLEQLATLPAVFKEGGTVTAGNSSGRNDGAACLVLMSADGGARGAALQPLATIRSQAVAGVPPEIMGIGPVPASRKALAAAGLTLDDIGLIELNEAFAAQSSGGDQGAGPGRGSGQRQRRSHRPRDILWDARERVSLPHCSTRCRRRGTRYGLATLCIAGGQGIATVVEAAV